MGIQIQDIYLLHIHIFIVFPFLGEYIYLLHIHIFIVFTFSWWGLEMPSFKKMILAKTPITNQNLQRSKEMKLKFRNKLCIEDNINDDIKM